MNAKKILIPLVTAIVIGGAIFAYRASLKDPEPEKSARADSVAPRGTVPANTVVLDAAAQKRIGLSTEKLAVTNLNRQLKGFGRVLDPAPLVALATELASAEIAARTSRQELARLKILKENASEKALQLAESSSRRDEFVVESIRAKLKLTWGEAIASHEKLSGFLQPLVAGQKILIRVFLPPGELMPAKITGATFMSLASTQPLHAQFFEALRQIDEQTQGEGLLFLAEGRSDFRLGSAVTGLIQTGEESRRGVIVPRSAIVRIEGKAWVYLKMAADLFVRHEVNLEMPTDDGWFVSGPAADSPVVVSGAQILLSEESKDLIRSGD